MSCNSVRKIAVSTSRINCIRVKSVDAKIKTYAGNEKKKMCGIKCRWNHNNDDDTIAIDKNKR